MKLNANCALLTLVTVFLLVFATSATQAQSEQPWTKAQKFGQYHLETARPRTVKIKLKKTVQLPAMQVQEWKAFIAMPPSIGGQQVNNCSLLVDNGPAGTRVTEQGGLHRSLLFATVPVIPGTPLQSTLVATVEYDVTLFERRLVKGPSPTPVEGLAPTERALYVAENQYYDFSKDPFKKWMETATLFRQPEESDLSCAYRAWQYIISHYHYRDDSSLPFEASKLCLINQWDCGRVSIMFCAAMRSNGIPARVLIGRNAYIVDDGKETNLTRHAHAEFYVKSIGWIPLEFSPIQDTPNWLYTFGSDNGRFLTQHLEWEILAPTWNRSCIGTQDVNFMASGKGTFTGSRIFDTASGFVNR